MGIQTAVELDEYLFCNTVDRSVCVWVLWSDAHFNRDWTRYNDHFETQDMVRVLSYGNDDTRDM